MRFTILVAYALFLAACSSIPAPSPAVLPASTPVSTLALAPTLATEPTSTPSPTAMPTTPPPTATVLMPVPDGMSSLCENAFYPAPVGAQWQYRVTLSDGGADTYTKEIRDLADNSFTEHRTYADTSADHQWTCTNDGLVSKEFANLHIHGLTQYRFTTTRFSGITLPPLDQWQIGTVWSNSYDVNGEINQNGTTTSGTGVVAIENEITAKERTTVPAGTFESYRVDSTITLRLSASVGLFSIPVTLNVTQTAWYAQDTGMVRSTLTLRSDKSTVELVSFTP